MPETNRLTRQEMARISNDQRVIKWLESLQEQSIGSIPNFDAVFQRIEGLEQEPQAEDPSTAIARAVDSQAPIVQAQQAIEQLQTEVSELRAQVAVLMTQINDLTQGVQA